jgi:ComF family protein
MLFWHEKAWKVNSSLKKIKKWFWPYHCCLCGGESDNQRDLCTICTSTLPWIVDRCIVCGLRLEGIDEHVKCERCHLRPPSFDRLYALFSYDPPVTKLVTGLKFGNQLAFGRVLGELLADKISEWYQGESLPDAIIPVPLYASRLRKRGYNQVLELLWPILKQHKLTLLLNACIRVQRTLPQSGLNADHRRLNVAKAFKIEGSDLSQIEHVAIVDDVVTTASTVNALSRTLKQAGIQRVDVWCSCRA